VIDSCVLIEQHRWLDPIVLSAQAGYVVPIWSPCIIAEANRVLTWLWIRRQPPGLSTTAAKRTLSEDAHRWFSRVSPVFESVDDRPPFEPMWTPDPKDPYDAPVWTAAVRGKAHFVVTANLEDGPPPDENAVQRYGGILYIHLDRFLPLLNCWANVSAHRAAAGSARCTGSRPRADASRRTSRCSVTPCAG